MSDVVISPNMSLPVPVVGVDPGPDWANNINACLGILDEHNHSPGQGVQITPTGININADLPINSNNLTTVKTVNFTSLGSTLPGVSPNLGCIYVAGSELVYNDEAGNVVPITLNGSVNAGAGSITGLPSGTASASYSGIAQTFTWQSATNTPANMDMASIVIRPLAVSPNGITISAPSGLSANYSLTLPTSLPPSTSALSVDSSGTMSFAAGGIVPTGAVIMFGGVNAPSGFLLCDGTSYLKTSFPNLAAALFDSATSHYAYGSADSTHFNVPDMRGLLPRGTDPTGVNDPDFAARTAANANGNTGGNVGSFQPDGITTHTHETNTMTGGGITLQGLVTGTSVAGTNNLNPGTVTILAGSTNITSETRPKNLYFNFIIKT